MSNKVNRESPLVKSVLALDGHLSELERVGEKINSTDMTSDFDIEHIQKLMARFAECGQGIAEEVSNLSRQLQEAQTRAEGVAQRVSAQANLFNIRRNEQNEKLEKFQILGDRVRELNAVIGRFRRPKGEGFSNEDRAELASDLPVLKSELTVLIEELQNLRKSARDSRMKALEKSAESLIQSLQAVQHKLRDLKP